MQIGGNTLPSPSVRACYMDDDPLFTVRPHKTFHSVDRKRGFGFKHSITLLVSCYLTMCKDTITQRSTLLHHRRHYKRLLGVLYFMRQL